MCCDPFHLQVHKCRFRHYAWLRGINNNKLLTSDKQVTSDTFSFYRLLKFLLNPCKCLNYLKYIYSGFHILFHSGVTVTIYDWMFRGSQSCSPYRHSVYCKSSIRFISLIALTVRNPSTSHSFLSAQSNDLERAYSWLLFLRLLGHFLQIGEHRAKRKPLTWLLVTGVLIPNG